MNLLKFCLFLLLGMTTSAYAMDGGGVGMVSNLILFALVFLIGGNLVSIIIVAILLKKIEKFFEKKSHHVIYNPSITTIRDIIHQKRTWEMKTLYYFIPLLSFLFFLTLCYVIFIIFVMLYHSYGDKGLNGVLFFFFPAIFSFIFLFVTFLFFTTQYYAKKIRHIMDFKAFKQIQKENGQFIMPTILDKD